jgi:hypothetical protein
VRFAEGFVAVAKNYAEVPRSPVSRNTLGTTQGLNTTPLKLKPSESVNSVTAKLHKISFTPSDIPTAGPSFMAGREQEDEEVGMETAAELAARQSATLERLDRESKRCDRACRY